MQRMIPVLSALIFGLASPVAAEFSKVENAAEFKRLIGGKILTRPLVKLTVGTDGAIAGKGAAWPISGTWTWKNGYFCWSLEWGGDDLGYNCQEVKASASKIRFTSDEGRGDSADFSLR